jgi:hypothetical protein
MNCDKLKGTHIASVPSPVKDVGNRTSTVRMVSRAHGTTHVIQNIKCKTKHTVRLEMGDLGRHSNTTFDRIGDKCAPGKRLLQWCQVYNIEAEGPPARCCVIFQFRGTRRYLLGCTKLGRAVVPQQRNKKMRKSLS